MNMRLLGTFDRKTQRFDARGEEEPVIGLFAALNAQQAGSRIDFCDLTIQMQFDTRLDVEAGGS
jgi:hypothetical protein